MNDPHLRVKQKAQQAKLLVLGSKGSLSGSKNNSPLATRKKKVDRGTSPNFGHFISKSSLISQYSQKSNQKGDSLVKLKKELMLGVNFP